MRTGGGGDESVVVVVVADPRSSLLPCPIKCDGIPRVLKKLEKYIIDLIYYF